MALPSLDPWFKKSYKVVMKRKRKAKRKLPKEMTGRLGARARRRTGREYKPSSNWWGG
jgi:hypothetical protein